MRRIMNRGTQSNQIDNYSSAQQRERRRQRQFQTRRASWLVQDWSTHLQQFRNTTELLTHDHRPQVVAGSADRLTVSEHEMS